MRFRYHPLGKVVHQAIKQERLEDMKQFLHGAPADLVNAQEKPEGRSLLGLAMYEEDPAYFKWVLSHPNIDVNVLSGLLTSDMFQPVFRSLLLRDHRAILGRLPEAQYTPLLSAVHDDIEVMKVLMADGRPLDEDYPGPYSGALGIAKREGWPEKVALIEEYKANPTAVTKRLRRELGVDEQDAARLYTLLVIFCDGFLSLPFPRETQGVEASQEDQGEADQRPNLEDQEKIGKARRFFAIAKQLPLELQALLCLRVYDCPRDVISRKLTEAEFEWLLERLSMEDYWNGPTPECDYSWCKEYLEG